MASSYHHHQCRGSPFSNLAVDQRPQFHRFHHRLPSASPSMVRPLPVTRIGFMGRRSHLTKTCRSGSDTQQRAIEEGDEDADAVGAGDVSGRLLLVERYKDGTSKRYILDANSQLQSVLEGQDSSISEMRKEDMSTKLSWLPTTLQEFVLPAGFPGSVSDDYLDYMLLQFPTNVTGWLCHTLVTSSLLKAVGIGSFSGTEAAASAAAIRWVSKDGLGAVGRLLIGGRFGKLFDDDPKQWRMYADFVGSAGSIFELSTQMLPGYFLLLASLGNFTKALARGLKDPSFRVIQNHFAISDNLGEVAAKEEVWEVAAQLVGLSLGILVLDFPGIHTSYNTVVLTWLSMRILHLWLRYQSLAVLRFPTINLKRARILVRSHVLLKYVPDYVGCNNEENILCWEKFSQPHIVFGTTLSSIVSSDCGSSANMVENLLNLYSREKHILFFNEMNAGKLEFLVSFKVEASSMCLLRSLWQAYWLSENWRREHDEDKLDFLHRSLENLNVGFNDFLEKLEGAGWSREAITIKVPNEVFVEEVDQ